MTSGDWDKKINALDFIDITDFGRRVPVNWSLENGKIIKREVEFVFDSSCHIQHQVDAVRFNEISNDPLQRKLLWETP